MVKMASEPTRQIHIQKINTKEQLADIMTKGLHQQAFDYLRDELMGWHVKEPSAVVREGVSRDRPAEFFILEDSPSARRTFSWHEYIPLVEKFHFHTMIVYRLTPFGGKRSIYCKMQDPTPDGEGHWSCNHLGSKINQEGTFTLPSLFFVKYTSITLYSRAFC